MIQSIKKLNKIFKDSTALCDKDVVCVEIGQSVQFEAINAKYGKNMFCIYPCYKNNDLNCVYVVPVTKNSIEESNIVWKFKVRTYKDGSSNLIIYDEFFKVIGSKFDFKTNLLGIECYTEGNYNSMKIDRYMVGIRLELNII